MVWWRRLFAEIFPGWHRRRLIASRKADDSRLTALQRYRRKIAMTDPREPRRDVGEDPARGPDEPGKGEKPVAPKPPPFEVPSIGEHVPTRTPAKAKR